ncbi:hypothetical protein KP509_37G035200 [Ceratopteris richardii]|uniref:Uncharacterized protein n=1 Tax=Ceratopteris richardii TaxID=49495 RepID=A0A8T2Q907_CERRI|nr:hypothetical protein KP509_37G035200 [Ceratopteris richardii]
MPVLIQKSVQKEAEYLRFQSQSNHHKWKQIPTLLITRDHQLKIHLYTSIRWPLVCAAGANISERSELFACAGGNGFQPMLSNERDWLESFLGFVGIMLA